MKKYEVIRKLFDHVMENGNEYTKADAISAHCTRDILYAEKQSSLIFSTAICDLLAIYYCSISYCTEIMLFFIYIKRNEQTL